MQDAKDQDRIMFKIKPIPFCIESQQRFDGIDNFFPSLYFDNLM